MSIGDGLLIENHILLKLKWFWIEQTTMLMDNKTENGMLGLFKQSSHNPSKAKAQQQQLLFAECNIIPSDTTATFCWVY